MRVLIVIIQLALTFIAVAITMPAILIRVPAARNGVTGQLVALTMFVLVFVGIRLIWPRRRK